MVQELSTCWDARARTARERQLVLAVNRGDTAAATSLLESKTDVNCRGRDGMTCLHCAAMRVDLEITRTLLDYEADPGLRDRYGNTTAHSVTLFVKDETCPLFVLLCPTA